MNNDIFSYTNRSLENARREGMSKIPIISRGDWTDLNATDPGMIILDYVHSLVDMINYYQDHQALETFISTAKERKNIFRLAKQFSYEIRSSKGSKGDVVFYLNNSYSTTIRIPKNTKLSTKTGIKFITLEDAYIQAGSSSVKVPVVQGVYTTEEYLGTGISKYSNIAHADNQVYKLTRKNIDIDTIEIIDNLNRVWSPTEYIVFSTETDRVFQADLEYDGTIDIKFGDGQRGIIPQNTESLYITYLYTEAEEGRVGSDTITIIEDSIYDIEGNKINIFVTNPESTSGGSGPMSDEEITRVAPGVIKAQGRAVTLRDFENLAKNVEGIADAVAYDINTAPELCLHHEVKVVIIPELGTVANNSLIKRAHDYLSARMIPPTNLQILAPSEVAVDISITAVKSSGSVEGGIEYSIQEAVKNYFDSRYGSVGESFNPNELVGVLNGVQGVRYIDSINPSTTVSVDTLSVVRLGNLTINVV